MTTPHVPLRIAFSVEVPGTPEQVWAAIATSDGISAWFLPTDVEEREGGAIVTHMGEADSPGTVTGWDPPRRFTYEEPEWAPLADHPDAVVTPLATEFVVEAVSGGTCVVRVVSSAFGTGADWENETIEHMERGWRPFFDRLRLYLAHFPGQRATPFAVTVRGTAPAADVLAAVHSELGINKEGQELDVRGSAGVVERIGADGVLFRLTGTVPGFLGVAAFDSGEGTSLVMANGQLFSPDAPAWLTREQPAWQAWLESLATPAT